MRLDTVMHVAVGVLQDAQGKVLITRRAENAHQGGLWEFPGGKLELGETVNHALQRELFEEIGVRILAATPLIKIRHDYGDRLVLLDVWSITAFAGQVKACEDQPMQWVSPLNLTDFAFPAANLPIIKAIQLPKYYAILEGRSITEVVNHCKLILENGVGLIQFRVKSLAQAEVLQALELVLQACQNYQVRLLINSDLKLSHHLIDGLHLSSRKLLASQIRPKGHSLVSASCHNLDELRHAEKLGLDFAVLAPVKPTVSHPEAMPLGWDIFSAMLDQINLPVFALGGLRRGDLAKALQSGAQGLAGISGFLETDILLKQN
jgi:8-oxo-dGTP diphosphatase